MHLHGLEIHIVQKKIKNMYLTVSPQGEVKVSAPKKMTLERIQAFVTSKFKWIKKQQEKVSLRIQPAPQHKLDPKRYALEVQQFKEQVSSLVSQWEKTIGVSITRLTIRHMRTRWGSCSPKRRSIRINLELAKHPVEHLEYIVVHELVHLLEPSHNKRFVAFMDHFLPQWRKCKAELNGGIRY